MIIISDWTICDGTQYFATELGMKLHDCGAENIWIRTEYLDKSPDPERPWLTCKFTATGELMEVDDWTDRPEFAGLKCKICGGPLRVGRTYDPYDDMITGMHRDYFINGAKCQKCGHGWEIYSVPMTPIREIAEAFKRLLK